MAKKKHNPLSSILSDVRNTIGSGSVKAPKKSPAKKASTAKTTTRAAKKAKRNAYYIQIGFDFGTSFSKCVIRDTGFNRAHIFYPKKPANPELPFLLPTTLCIHGTKLSRAPLTGKSYERGYLPFIKMALSSDAKGEGNESFLDPYRRICADKG